MADHVSLHDQEGVNAPEALEGLFAWLDAFDAGTRQRGIACLRNQQVEDVWVQNDHCIAAVVTGSACYEVTLSLLGREWASSCTCPVGSNCKHAYAVGFMWSTGGTDQSPIRHDKRAQPAKFPPGTPKDPRKKISFREQWTPVLTAKLGRPLTADEGALLGQLAALFTDFSQRYSVLYPDMLRRHGFGGYAPPASDFYSPVFDGWWNRAKPPADPWALWQYLAYQAERIRLEIPAVFRPMTDTAGVHAVVGDMLIQRELATWRSALSSALSPPGSLQSNPVGTIVALRARFAVDGNLRIETRSAHDKPWKNPPQAWYRSLGSAHPSDFEHLTPGEAALGVALAMECRTHPYSFTAKDPLPGETVAQLLRTSAARAAILLPDNQPFAVESELLVREAVPCPSRREHLDLRLVTASGRDASAATFIAAGKENLYLFENRIWAGPPPAPAARLPLAALKDSVIVSRLRATGLRLPEALEVKFRRVVMRPRLKCWLTATPNGFSTQYFYVQLSAYADDPPCEQHWRGVGGWQWAESGAPPRLRPDDPLLEFDISAAQAVSARFADFRLGWTSWDGAWSRPATKAFPEEFAAWHATLPPGVEIELSPELAGLIGPPIRAHVDFTALPANSGRDWFDVTIALRVEDTALTEEEIGLLLKARGKWVRLPRHGWRRLELAAESGAAGEVLDRLGLGTVDVLAGGKPVTHRLHALQLSREADALESRDAALASALRTRAADLAAVPPAVLPAGLRATLRPYQEEGFQFLAHLSAHGFGGVLADDMGLGKTVQTLGWLLHLAALPRKDEAPFRALVVCPKSVTHGWQAESERFAPDLNARPFSPAMADAPASRFTGPVLVANYTQLRLHAAWFASGAWDAVVLDEGQFIKNPASQVAVAARSLVTRHRLILTGTPVENRLTDLWSLFAFAQPGLLPSQAAFKRQYADSEPSALARLRRRVGHFLLRRTKAQAAPDLPPRTEDELIVELEGVQRKLYDAELKRARAQLLGVQTDRALDKIRFNVLASLLRLRQICCHPALVDDSHRQAPSAKLDALLERLEELQGEGQQVLVFSQFVEMLEIIRDRLTTAGIGHLMLTGATENRPALVEEFQRDRTKTVFLLSLKAAGFGLNLTAASYAILYDPWWNPAVEAQAIDRTHRIGQTKPVFAYRLIAANTVEQKIRTLQREKSTLAAAVIQEESLAKVMDLESLRKILL